MTALSSGHVGPPLPCNAVKLVDVAEMNYLAANGEGEVRNRIRRMHTAITETCSQFSHNHTSL